VKNKFSVGDTLELIHPQGNRLMVVETIRDKNGVDLQVALGSGIDVLIPLESQFEHALISRILTEAD
jgi:putative protease